MKFEVNQKDHVRYVEILNGIKDCEREKAALRVELDQAIKIAEASDELIYKKQIDSGKEEKFNNLRQQSLQVKDYAKRLEAEGREKEIESKKVFDRVLAHNNEGKQLRKEL